MVRSRTSPRSTACWTGFSRWVWSWSRSDGYPQHPRSFPTNPSHRTDALWNWRRSDLQGLVVEVRGFEPWPPPCESQSARDHDLRSSARKEYQMMLTVARGCPRRSGCSRPGCGPSAAQVAAETLA
jgi:hypothetical protein